MIGSSARSRLVAAATLLVGLAGSAPAAAEPRAEPRAEALAQVLFEEGVSLMAEGHFDDACPKLAESQRLDPGGGTLLNLASCLEHLGQLASSYATYSDALSAAIRDGRKEREVVARERLAAIHPLMSRLQIHVAAASQELEVVLDGTALGPTAWGTPLPIDPGTHTLTASAPSRATWRHTFEIAANGEWMVVDVPTLAAVELAPPVVAPPRAPSRERLAVPETSGRRATATVVLAGGGILVGLGAIAGALALVKKAESDDACPTTTTCSADGASAMRTAEAFAWTSNAAVGIGLAAALTGGILLLTSPRTGRVSFGPAAIAGSF